MPTPIISLDLETTGLEPSIHGPWEIAWATALHDVEDGTVTVLARQRWFVSLNGTEQLDPVALRIGGFDRYTGLEAAGYRLPWWAIQGLLFADLDTLRAVAGVVAMRISSPCATRSRSIAPPSKAMRARGAPWVFRAPRAQAQRTSCGR